MERKNAEKGYMRRHGGDRRERRFGWFVCLNPCLCSEHSVLVSITYIIFCDVLYRLVSIYIL
jgi:hypothetical protein